MINKDVKKAGRQIIDLSEEQEATAISLAEEGKTAKQIRDIILVSQHVFSAYLKRNPLFENKFKDARQAGLEELADSLQTIPDEEPDILRARLKSENMRWILSKRKAHVYGDRIEVNLNQSIDIAGALTEAKARALPDIVTTAINHVIECDSSSGQAQSLDDLLS